VDQIQALDGRALGKRGVETRRRLLDATRSLLETHGIRDLRVVDIAREVGTSPATFYQYFRDVEEAVLALAAEVGDEVQPLARLVNEPWDGAGGLDSARALVDGFVTYWDRHRAVLRTRNLAAQEGDARFREVRNRTLFEFNANFRRKIAAARARGEVADAMSPAAAAAALVALIERMAAFHRDLEPIGISREDLVETTARIIHQTVVGSTHPG
jgi:AcrR family transcriptional regulator